MSLFRRINIDALIVLAGLVIAEFTVGDAIGWLLFSLSIVFIVSVIVLLWKVSGWYGRRREVIHVSSGDVLTDLFEKIAALDKRIEELLAEVEKLKRERAELKRQAQEHTQLRRELEDRHIIETPPVSVSLLSSPVVLGVWPTPPGQPLLDQQAEADALRDAGYTYIALRGERATRAGLTWEVDRLKPTILQVGGHGNADGIMLSDGVASPGWWADLVTGTNIQLVVLMSCDSSQQDELNVSDALIRAGIPAVISCDSQIDDKESVRYVQLLYAKLSEGLPLTTASRRAKLALGRDAAEMIRLRVAMGKQL